MLAAVGHDSAPAVSRKRSELLGQLRPVVRLPPGVLLDQALRRAVRDALMDVLAVPRPHPLDCVPMAAIRPGKGGKVPMSKTSPTRTLRMSLTMHWRVESVRLDMAWRLESWAVFWGLSG